MFLKPQPPTRLCYQGLVGRSFGVQGRRVIVQCLAYLAGKDEFTSEPRLTVLNYFICVQKVDERVHCFY